MTHDERQSATSGILFDQRSRYKALAAGIRAIAPAGSTVLDVGCGEAMLLGAFLPGYRVSYLDPLLAKRDGERIGPGEILGRRLDQTSVPDASYDVAVCVDVLEHVPPEGRDAFVDELARVGRLGVVIAAPFAEAGDASATDACVHLAYRNKTGKDYPWLAEHDEHGLPRLADLRQRLESRGLGVTSFGNGHAPWLQKLLAVHVQLLDRHEHLATLRKVGDRFADELLRFDHLEPTYRQVVVANRGPAPQLPPMRDDDALRQEAAAAWHRFRMWFDGLLARHADELAEAADKARLRLRVRASELATLQSRAARAEAEAKLARERLQETQAKLQAHHQAALRAHDELTAVHRSLSWRITAPLRFLGRLPRTSRQAALSLAQRTSTRLIPERLRWPLKSAFFWVGAPLLRGTREYREFQDAKRWRQRAAPPEPPVVPPTGVDQTDVLVLGVIDWHLRIQRPQHLALELARRGRRVFYLTPSFHQANEPGYRIEQLAPELPVYQVRLHARERASIYEAPPAGAVAEQLADGMRALFRDVGLADNLCLVDHPGWVDLVRIVPRCRLVYDCMDNHHGFAESGAALQSAEARLLAAADGVVVTSDYIAKYVRERHPTVRMIRNACDPAHFSGVPPAPADGRPVVGYFGAVAQWFDARLVRQVAIAMPDCDFLVVGADTADVARRLGGLSNVTFVGEVPYESLPQHVARMNVLMIPFVIDELTLATNPVKAYEALAAGRPVVATEMPELMDTHLAPYVRTAADAAGMVRALRAAIVESRDPTRTAAMRAFAAEQTWAKRAADLRAFAGSLPRRRVGVVVVSWNGLALTRRCVESVLDDPLLEDVQVVVVDNASADGTVDWLRELASDPRVRLVLNDDNRGFAAACNQGLAVAAERDPELLVILNNDIVVTPGWATTLLHHLRSDPRIGLIGPVTNNIGNEARIDTAYGELDAMWAEQRALTGAAAGRTFEIPVLAFFCVGIPRDVYRAIGGLDENFGTGFFEDDDYCQRVKALGRRLVCAEDVFVHHELSASFARIDQEERQRLFERNRSYYESKWGPWQRHAYRPKRDAATG